MKAVKARKDRIVAQSVANLTRWLGGIPGLSLIRGHARFVSPHAVEVNGESCTFSRDRKCLDAVPACKHESAARSTFAPPH